MCEFAQWRVEELLKQTQKLDEKVEGSDTEGESHDDVSSSIV